VFTRQKGTTREPQTRRNSIDTAMDFYMRELDRTDIPRTTWVAYIELAKTVLSAAPKHPKYYEYKKQIEMYDAMK